jgi:hypothetical protein
MSVACNGDPNVALLPSLLTAAAVELATLWAMSRKTVVLDLCSHSSLEGVRMAFAGRQGGARGRENMTREHNGGVHRQPADMRRDCDCAIAAAVC